MLMTDLRGQGSPSLIAGYGRKLNKTGGISALQKIALHEIRPLRKLKVKREIIFGQGKW